MLLSPCGVDCESCDYFKSCGGCNATGGKPFYLKDFGMEICPIYDCSVNKKGYKSCVECSKLPCKIFYDWKDPRMSDEEHTNSINERTKALKDSLT
ncbi:MAG: DUF3795 domain-containing protein [Oscillospiraceae bacterium]|jgi:hypothetical protein|nr:DUF3795 domain-containing protein [Oscillospiraceae bacterium]